jgi:hypothetical protein
MRLRFREGVMTTTHTPAGPTDSIPIAGAWRVDGWQSRARFVAATLRGAAKVRGEFSSLSGSTVVGAEGASGTLTIDAASMDTGNRLPARTFIWDAMIRRAVIQLLLASAMSVAALAPGVARAVEPPTVFGRGASDSFIRGWDALDNQPWWGAQDLHSKAKLFVSFITTPSNGVAYPHMLVVGVLPSGQEFGGMWPTQFTKTDGPPSISSPVASVAWVPSRSAYHLTVDMPGIFTAPGPLTADLWFKGHPGAAAMPTVWDGQTSFFPQTIGAGTANGTIAFPGVLQPITAKNWGADAETEYGTYLTGTDVYRQADHIGYEWAESQNPNGSADFLLAFPEEDGVWRGMLSHTSATGKVTECEPNVALSGWTTDAGQQPPNVTGFYYPQTISASCATSSPSKPCLSMTWFMKADDALVLPMATYSFADAIGSVSSTVPGAVGWIQHFREKGSMGPGPAWTSTGLERHPACVVLGAPRRARARAGKGARRDPRTRRRSRQHRSRGRRHE